MWQSSDSTGLVVTGGGSGIGRACAGKEIEMAPMTGEAIAAAQQAAGA